MFVRDVVYAKHKGKRRGFRSRMHIHGSDYHELIYVDYGKASVTLNESILLLEPGSGLFISSGTKHMVTCNSDSPFDYLNVTFLGNPPDPLFGNVVKVGQKCRKILEALKHEELNPMPYRRELSISYLMELIVLFLRQIEAAVPGNPPDRELRCYHSEKIRRALKVIEDAYAEPLTLRRLGQAAGVGESRLRKLIKMEAGETFGTILHERRIAAAKHLLSEGMHSIEEISNLVGYRDTSFFFKVFKRLTGMTPRQYAQSLGEPTERM